MPHSRRPTQRPVLKTSLSKTWQETNGFCLLGELIPSFGTHRRTRHNAARHRPKHAHDILTAQEAIHLVISARGVAIRPSLPQWAPVTVGKKVIRLPRRIHRYLLNLLGLWRSDDDSRLANESSAAPSSADTHPSACHQSKWNFGSQPEFSS